MPKFDEGKSAGDLLEPVKPHVHLGHRAHQLEVPAEVDGPRGEGEVADVDGGGEGQGAYLRLRLAVVGPVPVEALLGRVGVEEGGGAGRRWQDQFGFRHGESER